MKDTFAVFKMRAWQRDLNPVEVFHDLVEARRFVAKLEGSVPKDDPTAEWRVYYRSKTDWVRLSDISLND